jgi:hypothetical protein
VLIIRRVGQRSDQTVVSAGASAVLGLGRTLSIGAPDREALLRGRPHLFEDDLVRPAVAEVVLVAASVALVLEELEDPHVLLVDVRRFVLLVRLAEGSGADLEELQVVILPADATWMIRWRVGNGVVSGTTRRRQILGRISPNSTSSWYSRKPAWPSRFSRSIQWSWRVWRCGATAA